MTALRYLSHGDHPGSPAADGKVGRILVVDDEPGIRKIIRALLSRHGLEVLEAADGATALETYRKAPEGIRLALIDLVMPGMDGIALAREFKRLAPRLALIVTSGIDFEHRVEELTALGITDYLHKPFHKAELLAAIASAQRHG